MGQGAPPDPSADLPRLHAALLAWYDTHRRDLPWRGLDDPYAIWVSEIMLQQTRVETVVPYFLRWMTAFPDVHTLAAADEESVLRLWSGLGYYSRARNLHAAAKQVVQEHDGRFPADRPGLQRLPGIGAYTSGAIASIAYGEPVPAVDGNVLRVLARLYGDARDIRAAPTRSAFESRAAALVPTRRAGDWNQALMELGATLCVAGTPRCDACPVASVCVAHTTGRTHALPVRRPKAPPRTESMHFAWLEREGQVLLVRNRSNGLLSGLWGLPGGPVETPLAALVADQTGHRVRTRGRLGTANHRFTHRTWQMEIHLAVPDGPDTTTTDADQARWVPLASLGGEAVSTAHRKAIAIALEGRPPVPPLTS